MNQKWHARYPRLTESNILLVVNIYKQIRFCVRKWISEQKDVCHNLQEDEDYYIVIQRPRVLCLI